MIKPKAMEENKEKNKVKGDGTDFIKERKAVDQAINEKIKSESGEEKIDPQAANNKNKMDYEPEDSVKKVGRTSKS